MEVCGRQGTRESRLVQRSITVPPPAKDHDDIRTARRCRSAIERHREKIRQGSEQEKEQHSSDHAQKIHDRSSDTIGPFHVARLVRHSFVKLTNIETRRKRNGEAMVNLM